MAADAGNTLKGCAAPAKLNLFLHINGRRADGYHTLQSVFQLVDLADWLDFTKRDDGRIERSSMLAGVAAEDDLCVRAARALQAATASPLGVTIAVTKRIPLGGGLGGGSSDAATTLLALNRLWQCGLSRQDLMQIGVSLGADVPFFIFGRNAFAEGIGEDLTAVQTPTRFYAVIHPGVAVPTAAIFSDAELTRNTVRLKISDFCEGAQATTTERLGVSFGANDLEPVARKRFPAVDLALRWLGRFGVARMTGSGACVFAGFDSQDQARASLVDLPEGWKGWVCASCASHPLRDWVANERT